MAKTKTKKTAKKATKIVAKKKTVIKKPVAKKTTAKKSVVKKPVTKKTAKKIVAKKAVKASAKKPVAKKIVAKKVVKKVVAKKSAKLAVKKGTAKKSVAKKVVKKSAVKKTAKVAVKKAVKPVAKKAVAAKPKKKASAPKVAKAPKVQAPIEVIETAIIETTEIVSESQPDLFTSNVLPSDPAFPEALRDVALKVLSDHQADDVVTADLHGKNPMADYAIVASGRSSRQTSSLADFLREAFEKMGVAKVNVEGADQGDWVLVDAGDVIVHIFRPEVRSYYAIEEIWAAKPKTRVTA